ncbi:MAG: 2-oxoacid:acceptor oxidoreductase family protein [Candidatus Omnitrophica bacterium]|nr:2-oxoacid:acceptor oxidoreductase family protein [Candidatus Omnitrophota bacterium]
MTEKIIIAGSGGQGVMLLGKVIAEAAMKENKFVTWLPCYGAEVRGGTAYCMVIVSNKGIGSPYVDKADSVIIMNSPSLAKFEGRLAKGGFLLINSSLVHAQIKTAKAKSYPFTEIAQACGNIKTANMVALGALIAHRNILKEKSCIEVMKEAASSVKKELIEINISALKEGIRLK